MIGEKVFRRSKFHRTVIYLNASASEETKMVYALTIRILEQKVQLNGADNFYLVHM